MIKIVGSFRLEDTKSALLNDSLTFKVGDVVIPLSVAGTTDIITNATGAVAATGKDNLGLLVGFCKANDEVIGQGQDPLYTPNQLATAANNTTVVKYYGRYIPLRKNQTFIFDLDAAANTTAGSNKPWVMFNLADAHTVDESTVKPFDDATKLQVLSHGLVEGSTTQFYGSFRNTVLDR